MGEKLCIHTQKRKQEKKKKEEKREKETEEAKRKLSFLSLPLPLISSAPLYWEFGLFFLPMPTTTLTKRRLYLMRFMARPCLFVIGLIKGEMRGEEQKGERKFFYSSEVEGGKTETPLSPPPKN